MWHCIAARPHSLATYPQMYLIYPFEPLSCLSISTSCKRGAATSKSRSLPVGCACCLTQTEASLTFEQPFDLLCAPDLR